MCKFHHPPPVGTESPFPVRKTCASSTLRPQCLCSFVSAFIVGTCLLPDSFTSQPWNNFLKTVLLVLPDVALLAVRQSLCVQHAARYISCRNYGPPMVPSFDGDVLNTILASLFLPINHTTFNLCWISFHFYAIHLEYIGLIFIQHVHQKGNRDSSVGIVTLATGWTVLGSNPVGGEIFHTRPDRPWGPSSLLYNGYQVFPGGKAAGAWR